MTTSARTRATVPPLSGGSIAQVERERTGSAVASVGILNSRYYISFELTSDRQRFRNTPGTGDRER